MTLTTARFEHVGTEGLREDMPFFYVAYNIAGASIREYNLKGGGDVRRGALADAKAELMKQFPLGPNQAYINLSIDEVQTNFGIGTKGVMNRLDRIVIRTVVSADVIEYGTPPAGFAPASVLNHPESNRINGVVVDRNANDSESQMAPSGSGNDANALLPNDAVVFMLDGQRITGTVIRKFTNSRGVYYSVSYKTETGRTRYAYVKPSDIVG